MYKRQALWFADRALFGFIERAPPRPLRIYLIALSVVITILVGLSRVYLGVHWPTDVLAGWTLGAAWALIFWLIAVKVDRR